MTRIRSCREARGMSQKFVAISIGVSPPTVSMWENGTKEPTRDNLVKLADLFNVSLDYLVGRDAQEGDLRSGVMTYEESILLQMFRKLNRDGRDIVLESARTAFSKESLRQEDPSESAM